MPKVNSKKLNQEKVMAQMISQIETYCQSEGLDHRFVGGISYGGLLNEDTTYKIDVNKRIISLSKHNPLTLLRSDGSVRDIDIILASYKPEKIPGLRRFLNKLKWQIRLQIGYAPPISFEGFFPLKGNPPGLLQYVTTLRHNENKLYLAFDRIYEEIEPASLEAWTLILTGGLRYTTRNPIADYYAYQFRSPGGIKPKDITKLIYLQKLVDELTTQGEKVGIDYNSEHYYGPWREYISRLEKSALASVRSKRFITKLYWNTIGTPLAHGKGFLGKTIFALFNLVTRFRQ